MLGNHPLSVDHPTSIPLDMSRKTDPAKPSPSSPRHQEELQRRIAFMEGKMSAGFFPRNLPPFVGEEQEYQLGIMEHRTASSAPLSSDVEPTIREHSRTLPGPDLHYPSQQAIFLHGENKTISSQTGHCLSSLTESGSNLPTPFDPSLDAIVMAGGFNILDMNLTFPVKLHMIISYPACHEYLQWCSHGRAWKILKPKAFEAHVLPKFFRSAKQASFMRQVRKDTLAKMISSDICLHHCIKTCINLFCCFAGKWLGIL
jgi:HSF-type DNA-binding